MSWEFHQGSGSIKFVYFARVRNCISAMKIPKSIAIAMVEGFKDDKINLCRAK